MKKNSLAFIFSIAALSGSVAFAAGDQNDVKRFNFMSGEQTKAPVTETKSKAKTNKAKTPAKKQAKDISKGASDEGGPREIFNKLYESGLAGGTVAIAPYTSQPTYYSGGQLVVLAPSVNEDAKLLYRRMLDQQYRVAHDEPLAPSPRLVLSGKVEGKALYDNPYAGDYSTDVDLSGAELDMFAEVTKWVSGFAAFSYEDNASDQTTTASKRRISNSRVYLDKGFVTIGNFNDKNWYNGLYGSLGQMYVPFGRYASSMISDPLTKFIGKTKARAVTINYTINPSMYFTAPYARAFLFRGDTNYGSHTNIAKNYGIDAGLLIGNERENGELGASYISNLGDANTMQDNGASSGFRGFQKTDVSNSEDLVHRVGGISVHGSAMYGPISALAEYVTALTEFAVRDLSYNGHGACPSAFSVEAAYAFNLFDHSNSFALGYDFSRQALGLNVPKQRYLATWAVSIWKNTTFSLEYRHDINYGKGDTASGGHSQTFVTAPGTLGQTDNAVTAQLGIYF